MEEICNFAEPLEVIEKRELTTVVGFEAEISLNIDIQSTRFENDNVFSLPPFREVTVKTDWNTNILDIGDSCRQKTYQRPVKTFTFHLSGLKAERDKLESLYNTHGDFSPVQFTYDGATYNCVFEDNLTFTDKIEVGNVIGYEAEISLTECFSPEGSD